MISRTSICSSVVATLATLVLISPSAAQACAQPVGKHCYSIIRSEHQYEGTWVDMVTSADNVTGWNKGDYVQDETWASFPGGGWVEVGDTTGAVDWGATPTPVYFYAGEYPANEKNYYEGAFSTGPSIEQWFWVQEQDEGNGTWCVWIDGGETQCVAGRPLYTSEVEAGLEAAVDYPVTNDGTGFAWAMNPGGAWSSWAPEKFIFNGNYCIYGVPWNPNSGLGDPGGSGLAGSGLVFSTPTNNPYCNKKSQTLASPVEDGVDGLTIATEPAKPVAAGYTLANGPTLSDGQLQEIAREVAKNASDEEAASGTLQAVETTLNGTIGDRTYDRLSFILGKRIRKPAAELHRARGDARPLYTHESTRSVRKDRPGGQRAGSHHRYPHRLGGRPARRRTRRDRPQPVWSGHESQYECLMQAPLECLDGRDGLG